MADTNTRQGKRTPVTLKIKFKSETLEQFIERYAVDVSQGGIFIRTKEPLAVGTQMKFEFQLRDASPLIAGEGTVVWTRENDPSRPAIAPGMGVRFDKLAEGSQQVLEKILAEKAKQAPQRSHTEPTKPPMFTDTPTRVAPAPVQDALLTPRTESKNKLPRARSDSEQTPLPKPMPFHSDADEFPEEAFEEATKVRSLDELVAQTAEAEPKPEKTTVMPLDELAERRKGARADSTLADPPAAEENPALATKNDPDRESAPGLPSPPDAGRKVLDTSPSPRPSKPAIDEAPAERSGRASTPPANESPAKTKLGLEPAKAATAARDADKDKDKEEGTEKVDRRAAPRTAVASEPSRPHAPSKPSIAPIIIGVLVLVAAGVAALWFFVLREPTAEKAAQQGSDTELVQTGSADTGSAAAMTGSDMGSAAAMTGSDMGSAVAMTGSAGATTGSAVAMAGSAATPPTKAIDTVITSPTPRAMIEILTTGQSGKSPLTAKLEKDKTYKGRVTAPGYVGKELVLKAGEKMTVRLEAKPRILTVTSDPPGAEIYVDGAATGQQTPADVKLSPSRTKVRVTLRKSGFRALDQQVDVMSQLIEDDNKLSGNLSGKLEKAPVVANPGSGATHNGGAGSAATPTNGGTGSAATPESGTGGTGTSGTGTSGTGTSGTGTSGTGTSGTGTSGAGTSGTGTTTPSGTGSAAKSGEPEPDWSKQK